MLYMGRGVGGTGKKIADLSCRTTYCVIANAIAMFILVILI